MKEFPIIINEVKDGKYETKHLSLQTKGDIKKKVVRAREISKYLNANNYEKYCICSDCALGPLSCPKMADISKKEIEKYPFITTGFQVIDIYQNIDDIKYSDSELGNCEYERTERNNGLRIEKFIISKCKKYSRYRTEKK